jgi:hypothetical protein
LVIKVSEEKREAEELREVLAAVSEFLKGLKEPLMDLVNTIMESLSGEKLGEEVASFYKRLVEAGVPENVATEMTREYMKRRLEAVPSLGSLLESFGGAGRKHRAIVAAEPKDVGKAIEALERLKERFPEKSREIEKAIEKLRSLSGVSKEEGETGS